MLEGFGKRLKALRNEKKLKQTEMAEIMGITDRQYQRYEYGTREPAFRQLIALADYFDVSLDYLVGRSDDPTRH